MVFNSQARQRQKDSQNISCLTDIEVKRSLSYSIHLSDQAAFLAQAQSEGRIT